VGRVGAQRQILSVNEPKKTGQKPLSSSYLGPDLHIFQNCPIRQGDANNIVYTFKTLTLFGKPSLAESPIGFNILEKNSTVMVRDEDFASGC
jgi:hypothetical protein